MNSFLDRDRQAARQIAPTSVPARNSWLLTSKTVGNDGSASHKATNPIENFLVPSPRSSPVMSGRWARADPYEDFKNSPGFAPQPRFGTRFLPLAGFWRSQILRSADGVPERARMRRDVRR